MEETSYLCPDDQCDIEEWVDETSVKILMDAMETFSQGIKLSTAVDSLIVRLLAHVASLHPLIERSKFFNTIVDKSWQVAQSIDTLMEEDEE